MPELDANLIRALADRQCPQCKMLGVDSFALPQTFFECEQGHRWWRPNPGPQTQFCASSAHEILYGGAAGGGKSAALVNLPLTWVGHPHFKGVLIRRETGQLEELIDLSRQWYPIVVPGARWKSDGKAGHWDFPTEGGSLGARIIFGHCKDEGDYLNYQGKQYQFIGFDELTHFTETQYTKIKSRIRSPHPGLPRFTRGTTNPGGPGHEWVLKRWGAWLNPKFCEEHEAPGLVPRFAADGTTLLPPLEPGKVVWIEKGPSDSVERYLPGRPAIIDPVRHGSRVFIPAKLSDNRVLMENDPGYARNLADLDAVTRAQLADGNWLIKPAKGLLFKRAWWRFIAAAPAGGIVLRYWDRAGSDLEKADWTAGVKMVRLDDFYFIVDVVRLRGTPGEVEQTILNTAKLDGLGVMQVLELDPGQAGKFEVFQYQKLLSGYDVRVVRPTGDKVTRAKPFSAQVEAQNVFILSGKRWNEPFIQELEGFPEDAHDDQVDAASGAYTRLLAIGGPSKRGSGANTTKAPPPSFDETPLG